MRYSGAKGAIHLSTTASGAVAALVSQNGFTLDKTTDKIDVTCCGDPNKVYAQGLPDIKGTISAFFDSASDALFDASESSDGVSLYLYPSSLLPGNYHYGPAWIDASLALDAKGAVTMKGSFVAAGAWGRMS